MNFKIKILSNSYPEYLIEIRADSKHIAKKQALYLFYHKYPEGNKISIEGKMKRYNKIIGKMWETENGDWVSFDDYDEDIGTATVQNISLYNINEELHKKLIEAADKVGELTRKNLNLEKHLSDRDEMLIEKANVIINQCDQLIKQDIRIKKLELKNINILLVIWFGLAPTII